MVGLRSRDPDVAEDLRGALVPLLFRVQERGGEPLLVVHGDPDSVRLCGDGRVELLDQLVYVPLFLRVHVHDLHVQGLGSIVHPVDESLPVRIARSAVRDEVKGVLGLGQCSAFLSLACSEHGKLPRQRRVASLSNRSEMTLFVMTHALLRHKHSETYDNIRSGSVKEKCKSIHPICHFLHSLLIVIYIRDMFVRRGGFGMPGPGAYFFGDEERKEVLDVLESGYLSRYGREDDPRFKQKVVTLEREFAKKMGVTRPGNQRRNQLPHGRPGGAGSGQG